MGIRVSEWKNQASGVRGTKAATANYILNFVLNYGQCMSVWVCGYMQLSLS